METRTNAIMRELIERGYECQLTKVIKNGISKTGIVIKGKSNVSPTYYADEFEGNHKEVAERIIKHYNDTHQADISFDIKSFTEWERVKNTLGVRLRKKCDDGAVTRDYLDLELCVVSYVEQNFIDGSTGTIKVLKEHLDLWDVTEDELFEIALARDEKHTVRSMNDLIPMPGGVPMWVLSNGANCYGASVLLNISIFSKLAEQVNEDLFIIPSSIHECIAVPASVGEAGELLAMIRKVNTTDVAPEEVLSFSLYKYSRGSREITIE